MRLTILGGGGFRVPLVYSAVTAARHRVPITEVTLHDSDPARLAAMGRVLEDYRGDHPGAPAVRLAASEVEAITGADVVFAAIRVGGTAGRVLDERVALGRGLLGQETIGAGGLAYALRTVPVMERLARLIATHAPDAWVINFTNPAGMITEAMRAHHARVVGICDTPIGLVRRVARVLDLDLGDWSGVDVGYLGLNHLGWLKHLIVDGVDRLPALLADAGLLERIEEARLLGLEWVQTLGALPNEYLYYYYFAREVTASVSGAAATRGEFLDVQQSGFYSQVAEHPGIAHKLWQTTLDEREATYMAEARGADEEREEADQGGGYHEVAIDLMAALLAGERNAMILDVPGEGAIPDLPDDAVVEMPCRVDAAGVHPILPAARLGLDELGLVTAVKGADRLLIEAARTGSRSLAWRAFGSHPLVDSVAVARGLVDDYIAAQPLIARVLTNP
ncbi:6-phospho-beta-glucosidase [Pseudactinotalea sp. HY160]|uniref:family 4 glycosyl hydrolase n=1 Tax=Pseudactinotalea sp. HY160 TaxID=2654490 RepID=UPI00128B1AFE|nr:6-phospho-beta-glucosidase [Pseudactinotalea sp. HY160]MPV49658.1 6-phospho-beta-glucosidase [Pseudactinotalea sp. HY160]